MKLTEIELTNWCQTPHLTVHFNPEGKLHLLNGQNNQGKTNFLKAVCFALDLTKGRSLYGSERSIRRAPGITTAEVRLKIEENGKPHEIIRFLSKKRGGNLVSMDGETLKLEDAAEKFQKEWGCPHPEQLLNLLFLPQKRADMLIRETATNREERLARLKGFHRIRPKVTELEKKRKSLRAQREAVAAQGIIPDEQESAAVALETAILSKKKGLETLRAGLLPQSKRDALRSAITLLDLKKDLNEKHALVQTITTEANNQKIRIAGLKAQILPEAETNALHDALTLHKTKRTEKEIQTLLAQLPTWAPQWAEDYETALGIEDAAKTGTENEHPGEDGTPQGKTTAAETKIEIEQAVKNEGIRKKIRELESILNPLLAGLPAKELWEPAKAALTAENNFKTTAESCGLDPAALPSPGTLDTWQSLRDQAALSTSARIAGTVARNLGDGLGPLPYDHLVAGLHDALNLNGLPGTCPVSDNPLTQEGVDAARAKLKNRQDNAAKNSVIAGFMEKAAKVPALAGAAKRNSMGELLQAIKSARELFTPDKQAALDRADDIKRLSRLKTMMEETAAAITGRLPAWKTLSTDEKTKLVAKAGQAAGLQDELARLGNPPEGTKKRFENPLQPRRLQDLEKKLDEKHGLLKTIRDPAAAEKTAGTKSEEEITGTLEHQKTLGTLLAETAGKLTATLGHLKQTQTQAKTAEERCTALETNPDGSPSETGIAAASKSRDELSAESSSQDGLAIKIATEEGGMTAATRQLAGIQRDIAAIKARRKNHDELQTEETAHAEALEFLQPGNGPREILLEDLKDAIKETNERLDIMGLDLVLDCDETLQIYAGSNDSIQSPDTRDPGEDLGGGYGSLTGTFLHTAFLNQFNQSTPSGRIENLLMDEPASDMQPALKPGFYQSLTQEIPIQGLIMVEHEPAAESFAAGVTTFNNIPAKPGTGTGTETDTPDPKNPAQNQPGENYDLFQNPGPGQD
jgi:hypothetical protein